MLIYAFRDETDNKKIVLTDKPNCSTFQDNFEHSKFILWKKFQGREMQRFGFSISEQEHAIKNIKAKGYYLYQPH